MSSAIGAQYDKIAKWWQDYHTSSNYGAAQLTRALKFAKPGGKALDVGCGSGGRLIKLLEDAGFKVTGLDASSQMIALAQANHSGADFVHADIQQWDSDQTFDFILAWDSLFHLPLAAQRPVLEKLCGLLSKGGVMLHSFGDDIGEHTDVWKGQTFAYSSIGIAANIDILNRSDLYVRHLELDQYPEKHAFIISQKLTDMVDC